MASFKFTSGDFRAGNPAAAAVPEVREGAIGSIHRDAAPSKTLHRAAGARAGIMSFRKRVKPEAIVIFARQLATMIEAGLPLVQALEILQQQQVRNQAFADIIGEVKGDVEGGKSLSEAFEKHMRTFGPLIVNLVRAGENSGTLAEIMDRIAAYLEAARSLQKKVRSAMVYPLVVSIMAILITIVLLVKVIPVFGTIYESFGAALPLPTLILLRVSNFVRKYILLVMAVFAAAGFGVRAFYKTEKGRMMFDGMKFRVPIFGELIRKVIISRFSRTLATLVRSGVPILRSLDIVSKSAGNATVESAVCMAAQKIKEGESIAGPLEKTGVFPPMVVRMISVGEKTGKLDSMLEKISDFYDEQVNTTLAGLTSLIEPILIAFLGIVVGTIVICMFLPILKLSAVVKI